MSSERLVTVAVPVHKRLIYLPEVLRAIAAQNYPQVELIVSDNGTNGCRIPELVRQHYPKPFRFRQNPVTVDLPIHLNQLVDQASGYYFVMVCDDDLISGNYVSSLVESLERNPDASLAISKLEAMEENGETIYAYDGEIPQYLSGIDFLKAWSCRAPWLVGPLATNLAKTADLRRWGRHPHWPRAINTDFAIIVRLALNGSVALNPRCTFRQRRYRSGNHSIVASAEIQEFAEATRKFLTFLEEDATVSEFAINHSVVWSQLRVLLVQRIWTDYFHWWLHVYRCKLTRGDWIRAAFSMPYIPSYYASVFSAFFPRTYDAYRAVLGRRARR
ncbi:MAG TPA: glycosyltransferase family A protein [Candidatus Binatia bacterium]|jgi:glycosyltransferase involved in cell wall biosynthesis|nr:glycosyltransferase family A protein [Candidatus Binatia bacterium]